jgi:hypothetical protein
MKKVMVFIVFVVLISGFVYAKGGSSGGTVVKEQIEPERPDCESFDEMVERIECRLEFGQEYETTPEPCRPLSSKQRCVDAYHESQPCYDMTGMAKDQCFKEVAEFTEITVAKESNETNIRYYIVLLLYDLEERVEEGVEDGLMTPAEGARLITDIVDIKVMVLEEKSILQVKSAVADLDGAWPRLVI